MLHTQTMVIDADAHVLESERTWDYLEPADRKYRPVPITVPTDPAIGRGRRDAWVIDGKIRGLRFPLLTAEELAALSAKLGRDMNTQQASREMGDVDLRMRHMDALGIHVQVLHNTVFIESVSDRPEMEVALCRAWNRWMGRRLEVGPGTAALGVRTALAKYPGCHRRDPVWEGAWGRGRADPSLRREPSDDRPLFLSPF